MDVYKVITLPDPILRETAPKLARVDDDVREQMKKMVDTMYMAEGIGLAAPQVGILNRVIVIDTARREFDNPNPIALANPEIVWSSEEKWDCMEGCLSIPQIYAEVERPKSVRVKYLDMEGKEQELEVSGLASSCLQHEVDHLNGVLFIDYLSRLKRTSLMKKYDKQQKEKGAVL